MKSTLRKVAGVMALAFAASMLQSGAAHASDEVDANPCGIVALQPIIQDYQWGSYLTGRGSSSCDGVMWLMEERWYWTDKVIDTFQFEASPDGDYIEFPYPCSGQNWGNVYTRITVPGTSIKVESSSVNLPRCGS